VESRRIGPYEVAERLGAGGMGEVYRAWDGRLERWVAIKTILETKELSPERRERLRREARAVASLSHPAVTQVFDIVTDEGRDHVVMELVQGRPLSQWLEPGALATEVAVGIAHQIAAGLAAAHAKGIVHRDLKAENIVVADDLRVKILDFGLAKRYLDDRDDTLTLEGVVMGTSRAMSPEQAEGRPVDHRSDLFSLGSLLYQMLTGTHPFAVPSNMETMRRVVFHQPEPVLKLAPGVPPELAELTERLLAKKPAHRPQHAADVAGALDEVARAWASGSLSLSGSSRLTMTYAHRRPRRRRGLVLGGAAAAVVAVAAVAAWQLWPEPPTMSVAVMRPMIEVGSSPEQAALASTAVETAALETISAIEGLVAIDPLEMRDADGSVREIARRVAADEVLVTSVADCATACRVTVRRTDPSGAVVWSGEPFEVPSDNLQVLARAVASELQRSWGDRDVVRGTIVPPVDPLLFRQYLEVKMLVENPGPGATRDDLLERLAAIRREDPGFLEAHLEEASLARWQFEANTEERYLELATDAVGRALDIAPDDPRTLNAAVTLALTANELDAARGHLERLAELQPGSSRLLRLRAWLLRSEGRTTEAVELYRRLVSVRPSLNNLYAAAEAEMYAGNADEARRLLRAGLERAPESVDLLGKLAQLELMIGDPAIAVEMYERLAALEPHSVTYTNLGTARFVVRDFEGALEAYHTSLQLAPDEPSVQFNLGECYAVLGDHAEARRWFERALADAERIDPSNPIVGRSLAAMIHAHLGREREAAGAIQEVVRAAPDSAETHYTAAVVHALLGERASAVSAAERALELGYDPRWFGLPWFDVIRDDLEAHAPSP